MARMSIDDMFLRDTRVLRLAKLCGWSRRETIGALLDVYAIVYDRVNAVLSSDDIDVAAELEGFAERMTIVHLADRRREGIRIRGAEQRLDYLRSRSEHGRTGGLKSAELRRNHVKLSLKVSSSQPSRGAQAELNPLVPDPVPDLASASAPDLASDPVPDSRERAPRASAAKKLAKPLAADWSPAESTANQEAVAVAMQRGVDLVAELASMRDWATANGARKADWDATWRNWTRRARAPDRRGRTNLELQLDRVRVLEASEAFSKGGVP